MTFGELKREIARMEKNGWIDDNTEALVDDSDGHLIGFNEIHPYIKVHDWIINEKGVFSMAGSANVDNALSDAPVTPDASNKTETPSKARICPHYQGVCGLDDDILCYCSSSYEKCDKYNNHRCEGCSYHWTHSSGLEMCDKDWDCSRDMTSDNNAVCEENHTIRS